jgi:hypothetical protein
VKADYGKSIDESSSTLLRLFACQSQEPAVLPFESVEGVGETRDDRMVPEELALHSQAGAVVAGATGASFDDSRQGDETVAIVCCGVVES